MVCMLIPLLVNLQDENARTYVYVVFIHKNPCKTLIYSIFKSIESPERGLSGRPAVSIYQHNLIVDINIREL